MPSVVELKACDRKRKKKISKSVSAITHPRFTPFLMGKGSEQYMTVPFMFL